MFCAELEDAVDGHAVDRARHANNSGCGGVGFDVGDLQWYGGDDVVQLELQCRHWWSEIGSGDGFWTDKTVYKKRSTGVFKSREWRVGE